MFKYLQLFRKNVASINCICANIMMSHTCSLFTRMCIASGRRTVISAATKEISEINIAPFRVAECPDEHDTNCLNRIYTVPPDITTLLGANVPNELKLQAMVFREFGILIRKPGIEIMSYLEQADYTKPINKYILYGKRGTGKTTTLIHLIHYSLTKQFIVLYLPWVCSWFRFAKQVAESPLEPGKLDVPNEAVLFLKSFKNLNQLTLTKYDLKVSKEYIWTQREVTKCGEPLSNLIEFGIQRSKFACGVISALVDELKMASTAGKCRTLVVIDGFNAFTSNCTLIRDENRAFVPPERITITSAFFNSVDKNWCNGAAILTVDQRASKDRRESDYPTYLLGKKGFEFLDPFIPVLAENYSPEEFKTILEYYKDRKWIRGISPQGQRELELLSNKNPFELWNCCKPL